MMHVAGGQRPQGLLHSSRHLRPGAGWGGPLVRLEPPPRGGPRRPKDSLCTHSPSVQFLESSRVPLQSRPPFWGGGAMHSRLRQWAHSVLQADHLLHSVHAPSTAGARHTERGTAHARLGHAAQPRTRARALRQGRDPRHASHTERSTPGHAALCQRGQGC